MYTSRRRLYGRASKREMPCTTCSDDHFLKDCHQRLHRKALSQFGKQIDFLVPGCFAASTKMLFKGRKEGGGGEHSKIYYLLWEGGRQEERAYFTFLLNYGAAPQIILPSSHYVKEFRLSPSPSSPTDRFPHHRRPCSALVNSGEEPLP